MLVNAKPGNPGLENQQGVASPQVYCWREHPSVWFAVYGGRHSLRLACARQSVFLEDHEREGCALDRAPRAADHAAAQYSCHNFTPEGMLRFTRAAGDRLSPPEVALFSALAKAGALSDPCEQGKASVCSGVLAVGKGLSRQECEDTLVHECMHGLFYGCFVLRKAVKDHWHNVLSSRQRAAWANFLVDLGYNAERDEELAVNELLAYMCTEKQLLSRHKSNIRELSTIRDAFVAAIQQHVPSPAPTVGQAGCIWVWARSATKTQQGCKNRNSRRR